MGDLLTFVEQARLEADSSPVHGGDELANRLLASARKAIYHWPSDFAGFAAQVRAVRDQQCWQGHLEAIDSSRFRLSWEEEPDKAMKGWMAYQVGELLAHRESPERSRMASPSGVLLGDEDPLFGTRIVFPEDPMESYYRIKDDKIRQIARSYPKTRFVINIDSHHQIDGRCAAQCYSAFYWTREQGDLVKTETYLDEYLEVSGLHLPMTRRYSVATSAGLSNREIVLSSHRLLGLGSSDIATVANPVQCPFHKETAQ